MYRSLQRGSEQGLVGGIEKSHACVVATDWLRRIPSDARMMKAHDRIARHRPRRKIAMTNFVSTLCLVLLCSAIFLGSSTLAAAQKSCLDGTYILDETDSDNMNDRGRGGEAELPDARYRSRPPRETEPRLPPGSHHFFSE